MWRGWIGAAVVAGLAVWTVESLSAQQRESTPAQPSIMEPEEDQVPAPPPRPAKPPRPRAKTATVPAPQPDPALDAADQLAPSQVRQPMPAAVPEPSKPGQPAKHAVRHAAAHAKPASRSPASGVVTCSGPFGRNSGNLALAMAFDSRNLSYSEVDAGAGSKVMATILFAKEPKRRLEVWWANPTNRTGTYLIVINGQSGWTAPGGVRLGFTLAELEKLNHKPFKLKGFGKDNIATLSDWNGGALATLKGGCRLSGSLRADPKAPPEALGALPADHEFASTDAAMRAANPTVSEILIGY